MWKTIVVPLAMSAMLAGSAGTSPAGPCAEADRTDDAAAERDEPAEADDTARNVRDREDDTLTPFDQGGSEGDLKITQQIRRALVDDDELSTNAKNVKVITVDRVVTLRGPVESTAERDTIAGVARRTPGVERVENQLEVDAD
jgi:hyperosmotically inducible protein